MRLCLYGLAMPASSDNVRYAASQRERIQGTESTFQIVLTRLPRPKSMQPDTDTEFMSYATHVSAAIPLIPLTTIV